MLKNYVVVLKEKDSTMQYGCAIIAKAEVAVLLARELLNRE
jgi:hypothetical protein